MIYRHFAEKKSVINPLDLDGKVLEIKVMIDQFERQPPTYSIWGIDRKNDIIYFLDENIPLVKEALPAMSKDKHTPELPQFRNESSGDEPLSLIRQTERINLNRAAPALLSAAEEALDCIGDSVNLADLTDDKWLDIVKLLESAINDAKPKGKEA